MASRSWYKVSINVKKTAGRIFYLSVYRNSFVVIGDIRDYPIELGMDSFAFYFSNWAHVVSFNGYRIRRQDLKTHFVTIFDRSASADILCGWAASVACDLYTIEAPSASVVIPPLRCLLQPGAAQIIRHICKYIISWS